MARPRDGRTLMTVASERTATTQLRSDHRNDTTVISLDREAKRNALSATMVEGLIDAVRQANEDHTRLLVLRGNGPCFSAGFDFTDYDRQSEADLALRFIRLEQLLQAFEHSPIPTLALVHGKTFGAGADLAAACTYRVFDPDAVVRMPGLKFDLVLGSRRLAARTNESWAYDVLSQTRPVDASEALGSGLATRLAPQQDWDSVIDETATQAYQLSPSTTTALRARLTPDTRAEDMHALVESVTRPGLIERIRRFREGTQ